MRRLLCGAGLFGLWESGLGLKSDSVWRIRVAFKIATFLKRSNLGRENSLLTDHYEQCVKEMCWHLNAALNTKHV